MAIEKVTERRNAFKQAVDSESCRRRRQETTVQLRKNKKDEKLMKRRQGMVTVGGVEASTNTDQAESIVTRVSIKDLPRLVEIINSPTTTLEDLILAVRGIRKLLSVERNPPVAEVLNIGLLPTLIGFFDRVDSSDLMFEALWAVTNIASTDRTSDVVEQGALQYLIPILRHERAELREQAAWCIGNIAGDRSEYRDMLLEAGVMHGLLMNIDQPANKTLFCNVLWTVSNMCRGRPGPPMKLVESAIPYLVHLLQQKQGVPLEALVDAAWSLSYLSDGGDDRIQKVMESGVTPRLVELLVEAEDSPLLIPVVRILGNFVTGSDIQTDAVIEAGILRHLKRLLNSSRKNIKKESCWLASNIAAGTKDQIGKLIEQGYVLRSILEIATNAGWEARKEAIWAISNVCTTGNDLHIQATMQCGGLEPLVNAIEPAKSDPRVLIGILDAIFSALAVGKRTGSDYGLHLHELDGIDAIEDLYEHPNDEVYNKALEIVETFFPSDDVEEDENVAPETSDGGTFSFGLTSKQLFGQKDSEVVSFAFGSPPPKALGSANTTNMAM